MSREIRLYSCHSSSLWAMDWSDVLPGILVNYPGVQLKIETCLLISAVVLVFRASLVFFWLWNGLWPWGNDNPQMKTLFPAAVRQAVLHQWRVLLEIIMRSLLTQVHSLLCLNGSSRFTKYLKKKTFLQPKFQTGWQVSTAQSSHSFIFFSK